MIVIKDRPTVTAQQAQSILTQHASRRGVFIDIDRVAEYQSYFKKLGRPLYKEFRELSGNPLLEPTQHKQVREILKGRFNISAEKFKTENNSSEHLDKEVVTNLLIDGDISDDVKRFLELRKQLTSYNHRISAMGQYIILPLCNAESFEGHRMAIAQVTWEILSTSRISANSPSLQNLYRDMGDIITYPHDFNLVRADSGQIEPRIIYSNYVKDPEIKRLILLYNDAYFGLIHYLLYPGQQEKMEISDMLKDLRSQIKTMANAANYGSGMKAKRFDPALSRAFVERIQNHPMRIEWNNSVKQAVANGATSFLSAFGTVVVPEETDRYKKGSYSWIKHLERCGVNNPVQTTAGDLMNESVAQSDKILRTRGCGYSTICYYKHDEGCWLVHDKDMHLVDDLAGCMSYQVRDWIPIYSDLEIGKKKGLDMTDKSTKIAEDDEDESIAE